MKYKILDTCKIVDEEYIRNLLYEYETQDLLDNKEDYFKGSLRIDYQFTCIKKAIIGEIKDVINMLETNWNVPIAEIKEEK